MTDKKQKGFSKNNVYYEIKKVLGTVKPGLIHFIFFLSQVHLKNKNETFYFFFFFFLPNF